jgi:hypothetical protein
MVGVRVFTMLSSNAAAACKAWQPATYILNEHANAESCKLCHILKFRM